MTLESGQKGSTISDRTLTRVEGIPGKKEIKSFNFFSACHFLTAYQVVGTCLFWHAVHSL